MLHNFEHAVVYSILITIMKAADAPATAAAQGKASAAQGAATAAQGAALLAEQQLKEQQQQQTKHVNAMMKMEEQRQKVKAEKHKFLAEIVQPEGASKRPPGMPPMFPRQALPPMTPPPGMPPMGGWQPPPGMPGQPPPAKAKPSLLKKGGPPPARLQKGSKFPGWHARSQLVPKKAAKLYVSRVPAQDRWDDTEKVTLPIACCLLPVAYCLLPIASIAYCLLPIVPIAYCLLWKATPDDDDIKREIDGDAEPKTPESDDEAVPGPIKALMMMKEAAKAVWENQARHWEADGLGASSSSSNGIWGGLTMQSLGSL